MNFRGEKRCNDTHQSSTDADSVLYRKAGGKEARRYLGRERTQAWGYFVAGTYNLLRLARLGAGAAG